VLVTSAGLVQSSATSSRPKVREDDKSPASAGLSEVPLRGFEPRFPP
jgi:hypothetical protein